MVEQEVDDNSEEASRSVERRSLSVMQHSNSARITCLRRRKNERKKIDV